MLIILICITCFLIVSNTIKDTDFKIMKHAGETDTLTSLYNRRYLDNKEWAYYQGMPLSIISLDIDHFKSINDTYGHDIGDVVLNRVSNVIQSHLNENIESVRLGGDEVIIIIYNNNVNTDFKFAERLREEIQDLEFDNPDIKITASIGLSHTSNFEGVKSYFDQLLKESDIQLYQAKRKGRNQVSYTYI